MKKRKFKKMAIIIFAILLLYYITSTYFCTKVFFYNSAKSFMTYVVYGIIALSIIIAILFTFWAIKSIKKNKTSGYIWFIIIVLIFGGIQIFVSYNISKVSNSISKITNDYTTYSSSLITLNDSNITKTNDLVNKKIGIISDTSNVEGYVIPMEIIKEKKIDKSNLVKYDDFIEMLNDLYDEKLDAAFVSSSYASTFSNNEAFENINNDVTVIEEKSKTLKKNITANKTLTEPFTVLVLGVDSDSKSLAKSSSLNGDTIMLITFNPNTMNATILSIPRDTYVPIACYKNKAKNKINAAAYGGTDCMINTVTNLTGIKIDYWVKINFQGVVSLVDAIGGIDIDVPYAFCEQNSKRQWGNDTIYVEKGRQNLNGEQALAFARNRHPWPLYCGKKYSNYTSNDFIRGQNQQQILNSIMNKLKNIRSLSQMYDLLEVAGDNLDTNIDKSTMITGFDTFKNLLLNSKNINSEDFVGTQRLYLSGYDKTMDGIYYYMYYKQSLQEIVSAMKINLELEQPVMDKTFDYSVNEPYENKQIGKGTYKY